MMLIIIFIFSIFFNFAESKLAIALPTIFDFETTIKCTLDLDGTWCIQVWGLEEDFGPIGSNYDELGKTKLVCSPFSEKKVKMDFIGKDTYDLNDFEVVVGYRHNCTSDGAIKEIVSKTIDLPRDMYKPHVVKTKVLLNYQGTPKIDGDWTSRKFLGYEIQKAKS